LADARPFSFGAQVTIDGHRTPHLQLNQQGCPIYSQFYQVAHLKSEKQQQDREGAGASRWYMPDRPSDDSDFNHANAKSSTPSLPTLTQSRSVAGRIGELASAR
jgi:hypothetical protein